MIQHREIGIAVLILDCGCWVRATDGALDEFRNLFGLDPEALTNRIQSQHDHECPARGLHVELEHVRLDKDAWPPLSGAKDNRVVLFVRPGHSAPLVARPIGECS